jgi:5-methylcytosine-specific restriction endonuclease McrA
MISAKAWRQIQQAFKWQCGYCRMPAVYLPQGLQKEHIIPRSFEGPDAVRNICPACPNCNSHKTNKILGIDPESGEEVPLFKPRQQKWTEHFEWDKTGTKIVGRTKVGRATVAVLKMNLPDIVAWRSIIVGIGGYPPKLD